MQAGVRARRLAGRVVAAEGAALLALSLAYAAVLLVGHPHARGLALTGAALGVAGGLALVLVGRALTRDGRRSAWSPALVAQVLAVPVGIGLLQGGLPVAAVLVLVPALLTALLLVAGVPREGDAG